MRLAKGDAKAHPTAVNCRVNPKNYHLENMETRAQQISNLKEGDFIYSSLNNWYAEGCDLGLTEFPLNPTQFSKTFIQGKVEKKRKNEVVVCFTPMQKHSTVFKVQKLMDEPGTYFDSSSLPDNSIVVRESMNEVDYVVGVAPPRPERISDNEGLGVMMEREDAHKAIISKQWENLLAFRVNGVQIHSPTVLALKLPDCLKKTVNERNDLSESQMVELGALQEEIVTKLSVNTLTCNNLEDFDSFRIDLIEKCHSKLSKKKGCGIIEIDQDMPKRFAVHIIIPALLLTGCFERLPLSSFSPDGYHTERLVGSIAGLKKLGVLPSRHFLWKHPYIAVSYQDSQLAELSPFYDEIRQHYDGQLPYVINPEQLSASDFHDSIRAELGDAYNYNKKKEEILHDIMMKRLSAPAGDIHRNFGLKSWCIMKPYAGLVVIDFLVPNEGSSTWRMKLSAEVEYAQLTPGKDIETGTVLEALRDV